MTWLPLLTSTTLSKNRQRSGEPTRSPFEQDFDRIIFSHPFRRLQDKTQVHPLPEHDFVHTRLTHSLEVSSVGRSLGKKVGEVVIERNKELSPLFTASDFGAITAAASLAHDLGNPPFGHAGEDALSDFFLLDPAGTEYKGKVTPEEWEDLVRFEGNAQGFRILNKNQYGLRLTAATLGAFTKYPCSSTLTARQLARKSQKKFGFFTSEQETFANVASMLKLTEAGTNCWHRHPLAFLVEAADDICYSIIDLEDGCSLGLVEEEEAQSLFEQIITGNRAKLDKLKSLNSKQERIGYLRALAIGDLLTECSSLFLDKEKDILSGSFDSAIADHCASSKALKKIIEVSIRKIYRSPKVVEIEASGHEVLPGLLREFIPASFHFARNQKSRRYQNLALLLPEETRAAISGGAVTDYQVLREVIDFVSGLTDKHALSLYRKIKGISL
jgi:dGTPase